MNPLVYRFSLLSDTFAHGAYQTQNFNDPELRAPSIKGMIRWWHEALGFPAADARAIFGHVSDRRNGIDGNVASLVTLRIRPVNSIRTRSASFMPHKGHRGGNKQAIAPGTSYELTLTERREGLAPHLAKQLQDAVEAWLLLGAIGQRSNRAAGSIWWADAPASQRDFEIATSQVLGTSAIRFAVLETEFENQISARDLAGNFLDDKAFHGTAPFGSARPRKPSPLKLKCVEFDGELRLLAVWDRRRESPQTLTNGVHTLVKSDKEIGRLLEAALPRLTA